MQSFKVKFTEKAIENLIDITEYLNKFSPETALKYYNLIRERANSLNIFSTGYPLVRNERLREIGIRWTYARNYTIFFTVDEENNIVYIESIMHSRRAYDALL